MKAISSRRSHQYVLLTLVVLGAVGAALLGAVAGSAATKTSVKGTITTVRSPDCSLCFTGTIDGKLKGTVSVTPADVNQTSITAETAVYVMTGTVAIHTDAGDLTLRDATVIHIPVLPSYGDVGEFSALWTIVGGTGVYAGASGRVQVIGSYTFYSGTPGSAIYEGSLALA